MTCLAHTESMIGASTAFNSNQDPRDRMVGAIFRGAYVGYKGMQMKYCTVTNIFVIACCKFHCLPLRVYRARGAQIKHSMVVRLLATEALSGSQAPVFPNPTTLSGVFRENEVRRSYAWTPISLLWCRISNGYSSTSTSSKHTFFFPKIQQQRFQSSHSQQPRPFLP